MEDVYAIGDIAYMEEEIIRRAPTGGAGSHAASSGAGKTSTCATRERNASFSYHDLGSITTVGRNRGSGRPAALQIPGRLRLAGLDVCSPFSNPGC